MNFRKITKNDPPREGKKLVFLMFLGWNTRFPHENNAISHSFSNEVPLFRFGLILGVFWGLRETLLEQGGTHLDFSWATWRLLGCLGWLLGRLGEPCGTNLGFSWVTLCLLGSLVTQIWASVGWLCLPWGQICFFWVSGLRIKFFALSLDATGWVCGYREVYWWSRFRSMSMRKYWSRATHKTKCTHVRNLPVHVYMLILYMTCVLAATNYWKLLDPNLTMAGSTRYDCNAYIRLHWSLWLVLYTCKDP